MERVINNSDRSSSPPLLITILGPFSLRTRLTLHSELIGECALAIVETAPADSTPAFGVVFARLTDL